MAPSDSQKFKEPPLSQRRGVRFLEEEISFSGRFSQDVFWTIKESFYPFRHRVLLLLILGVFGRFCLLSTANVLGYWADSLCRGDHCRSIPAFFSDLTQFGFVRVLGVLVVIGFIINTFFRVAISRTGSRAVSILYDEVTLRTSRLPMSFFDATPVGRIISRFGSDYAAVFRMAGGPLGEFLCLVFDLFVMIALTTAASPWFVPVVVVIIVFNLMAYRWNNPRLRRERREMSRVRGPAIAHFAETVQGASPIKVYGKRRTFRERFNKLIEDLLIQRMRTTIAVNGYSLQMTSITASVLLATGVSGVYLVANGKVSIGALAVAFTFIMMTSTTIQQFFEWLANLEEALTGVERLDNYLRRPLEPGLKLPSTTQFDFGQPRETRNSGGVDSDPVTTKRVSLALAMDGVWMRYREDLPYVLQDINFQVSAGEHFAIVGRTGSGKSSLIQALFYLYSIQKGRISVGGFAADVGQKNDNHLISLRHYRRHFSLIPQEPILFRGTLRDNLVIHDLEAHRNSAVLKDQDEKIWHALKQVGVSNWVERLSSKNGKALDYFIEERGANLSAGERQLLCMARAMLLDAPVVIMDEATSSIDPHAEELLMHAMREVLKTKTRIVIAHRISTIEDCDRILWLDQGKVKMLGTSKEVLSVFSQTQ